MNYIATKDLTPSQAKELQSLGFGTKLVTMLSGNKDRYDIFVLGGI